jgi:hypothetical protein
MTIVVVSGALANKPHNGGNAWSRLSWVDGFTDLGFETYFVEQLAAGFDGAAQADAVAWATGEVNEHGLAERFAILDREGHSLAGLPAERVAGVLAECALLFNIGGHLRADTESRLAGCVPPSACRVLLDDDPGFTQFWAAMGTDVVDLAAHDLHLTFGANIGSRRCAIPEVGVRWHATRPPVVLHQWPVVAAPDPSLFTTVGTWRGPFGPIDFDGVHYGVKVHEFRKIMGLPGRVTARFDLALDIHPDETADLAALRKNGWQLTDPNVVASSSGSFQTWVQRSGSELSAAQGVYVATRSGWFSDRTVRYLASGRPAVVQDTGFAELYPVGEGLMPFTDLDSAAAGVDRVLSDYDMHAKAARLIAEAYFDATVVVGEVCELAGVAP